MRTALILLTVMSSIAAAQDVQVGARAKGMGGSYTAFGDDATAIWYNPAGLATQQSKAAIAYQSYVTYEFANGTNQLPGDPQATLQDPAFIPSFAGVVLALGEEKMSHAFSLAYINPLNIHLTWNNGAPIQTRQQISRFRFAYGIDLKINDKGTGLFPHVAVGGAIDWGSTTFEQGAVHEEESDFGYGGGVLLTLYDDGKGFSIDFGASGNAALDFDFNLSRTVFPVWDWPAMYSFGVAIYYNQLKITADVQIVLWEDAMGGSTVVAESFENTVNFGAGAEYAFAASEKITILIRAGFRVYDAPWPDEDPGDSAIGNNLLSIDANEEIYTLFAIGFGVYWTTKEGLKRGFDMAIEFGGDKITAGISYFHDF
jgi:hypothetical protein